MTIRNSGSRRSTSSKGAASSRPNDRSRARRRSQERRSLLQALEQRQLLAGPELAGIQPNEGSLLFEGTQLTVAPRELVFQFDDAADIDPATLDGIRITRAGDDNVFESAEVTTDFGTGGAVLVEFRAVQPGVAGNGIQIQLSSSSRSGSSLPIITVSGRTVAIDLNSNPSRATKVQDLLVALNQNAAASALIAADQVSGASLAPIGTTVVSGTQLVLEGANAAQAITDLGTNNAVRVRVLAATSGPEGRGLRLTVEQRNFFGQARPIVLVENSGVRVLVNSAPGFETTAAEFVEAVNENPQAKELLQLRLEAGSGSTLVGNRTPFYSPLTLTGASDIVVEPGFVGLGDSSREVVFRFAEPLPDDEYQIDIFGTGSLALTNTLGEAFNDGQDAGLTFTLNLGPQVLAVVPEPVRRRADGTRSPEVGVIEVHFNDDDLNRALAQDRSFYRLYFTRDTADGGDDVLVHPTSVSYNAVTNIARLQFDQPLARFADPTSAGQFLSSAARLKIGSADALPVPPTEISLNLDPQNPIEPGDSFATAFDLNSQWNPNAGGTQSAILGSQVVNPTPYELQLPGGPGTPGVRTMRPEDPTRIDRTVPLDYLRRGADSVDGISTVSYDFASTWLGDNPSSPGIDNQTTYFNVITEEQKQRVREVLQLFSEYLGIQFVETQSGPVGDAYFSIAVGNLYGGDVNATSSPGGLAVVTRDRDGDGFDDLGVMDLQDFDASTDDQFGGAFFRGAMLMVGQMLGYGLADDLPQPVTQSTSSVFNPSTTNEPAFPSTADIVNGQFLYRPDSTDVDLYRFELNRAGTVSIQTIAERLASSSLLDTAVRLYQQLPAGGFEEIAFNDDYFSNDSLVELELTAGSYVLGVSASGNTTYDPTIAGTGFGGRSEGAYELRIEFRPTASTTIRDTTGVALDGDADGRPGGVYNFWFQPADPTATIFVDKAASSFGNGTINNPFRDLDDAIANAQPGQTVRVLANGGADGRLDTAADNLSYQVGFRNNGTALPDGGTLNVPAGVTLVVDAGVIFKMQRTRVGIGSTTPTIDRSGGALQLLGTPTLLNAFGQPVRDAQGDLVPGSVIFTSFNDDSVGSGNTPSFTPVAQPGDWGGLDFRGELDAGDAGRTNRESDGVFLNHIQYADLRYGGGQVRVDGRPVVVSPIDMAITRPTIVHSRITHSANAAMSATPDTFTETRFDEPGTQGDDFFTPDYRRVGPDIHHNTVIDNSINGLFVRVATRAGATLQPLTAQARFDDTDIVHVLTENLVIEGTPGGPVLQSQSPSTLLVQSTALSSGAVPAGTYTYKLTYVDRAGNESPASARTVPVTLSAPGSIRLTQLPGVPANSEFESRHLYRATLTVDATTGEVVEGPYRRVASLNAGDTSYTDASTSVGSTLVESAVPLRARLDASLAIDPGTIIKLGGAGIDVTFGGQLLAEGNDGLPVVFTSLEDQRYGSSGTFDTHSGGPNRRLAAGDWAGIYIGHAASASLDHAVIAGAGGVSRIEGGFASFNPIEVHQGHLRLANSRLENNADGRGLPSGTRVGRGDNAPATLFALASTPVIVNNTFVEGAGPALSIDVNSLSHIQVQDSGRSTGANERFDVVGNAGPLVRGNRLGENDLNGLLVRGGQLTTEGVWDDTDIVHVVTDTIEIPNQFVFGGLRLESSPRESLVIKFADGDEPAAIVAGGSLLTAEDQMVDIRDRIGGSLQAVGFPDFPVITTSLFDDSVGAGFDPQGRAQLQTASSTFSPGTGVQGRLRLIQPDPKIAATAVGRVGLSTDALGTDGTGQLQVQVPAGSRVEQAYLHVPTRTFVSGPGGEFRPGAIGFGGRTVPLSFLNNVDDAAGGNINFGVGFAEVTSIVRSGVTFSGGTFNFQVDETITGDAMLVEGTTLTVIYSNPSLPIRTVLVLNGGLTTQQSNLLTFDEPIDPTASDFLAEMRLAISFSTGATNPARPQTSLIDINGQRLSSAAGGADDALNLGNGQLITYGGVGDNPQNPTDPNNPLAADDEYYTLTPLLTRGASEIVVTTENPSNDDSIFLSTFVLSGVVSLGPAPSPGDWTGLVIREGASDRNVAGVPENEAAESLLPGINPMPGNAQFLGELAANENSGDENRRLGFVVDGLIASGSDADVYAFIAEAGTEVWLDIDRSGLSLDSVVELIDANGQILALSNDSLAEQRSGAVHFVSDRLNSDAARPMALQMQRGETQRITIGENIVDASGNLRIGLAGSSNTGLISVADFLADPAGSVQLAINSLFPSLGGVDVTAARRVARQVDDSGTVLRRGDDFVLEVRFRDDLFLGRDVPNLSVDSSTLSLPSGGSVAATVIETTDASELQDQYSTNPRDAGMRVVLPGEAGARNLYHVRVRSSSAANDAELGNLMQPGLPGVTRGSYQLQIRLRETDEFPGTQVRFADVRYAANGLQIIGQPFHSPLLGDDYEQAAANETLAQAQQLGMFGVAADAASTTPSGPLQSDNLAISVGGALSGLSDVDWYAFDVQYEGLTRDNASMYLATVFDLDYADNYARADMAIYVFNAAGQLVLTGGDSNIAEDQPRAGQGTDSSDLSRGSAGALDPFIGTAELPEGSYFVAVSHQRQIPQQMEQYYVANPVNPLFRLEPIDSVHRIAEDHVVGSGGRGTASQPQVPLLFDPNSSVLPLAMDDLVLYTIGDTGNGVEKQINLINPFTGQNYGSIGDVPPDFTDFAFAPNGELFAYNRDLLAPNDTGWEYYAIDSGTASLNNIGPTAVQTFHQAPPNQAGNPPQVVVSNVGLHPEAITFRDNSLGFFVANRPGDFPFLGNGPHYFQNLLYMFDARTGEPLSGAAGDRTIRTVGQVTIDDRANGAGTQVRERGFIETGLPTGANPISTQLVLPEATTVTGQGQTIYVVDDGDGFTIRDGNGVPYRFEFNSGPEFRVDYSAAAGRSVRDGDRISVTSPNGTTVYEFNTGPVISLDPSAIADGASVTVTDAAGTSQAFEFDSNGVPVNGAAILVSTRNTAGTPRTQAELADALAQAINTSALTVDAVASPGTGRVGLSGDSQTTPPVANGSGITIEGDHAVGAGAVEIGVEENASQEEFIAAIADAVNDVVTVGYEGDRINFRGATAVDLNVLQSRGIVRSVTGNSQFAAGATPVPFLASDRAEDMASRVAVAVNNAGLTGITATTNGRTVVFSNATLNGSNGDVQEPFRLANLPPGGRVTGIAMSGGALYAVSDAGGLYRVANPTGHVPGNIATYIGSATDLLGIRFTGLVAGPQHVEGGRYADLLFGSTANGDVYAFNRSGELQPVFVGGQSRINIGGDRGAIRGLAFSTLDYNLWHRTTKRGTDPGHGLRTNLSNSRTGFSGQTSFYFGYEDEVHDALYTAANNPVVQPRLDGQPVENSYNFPGGASGALVSNEFDLGSYASQDQPYLYFNYFLQTDAFDSIISDGDLRRDQDAFRVYVITADGTEHLVSSNNAARGSNDPSAIFDDEFDDPTGSLFADGRFNDSIDVDVQQLFDNTGTWRQARVPLSEFAGLDDLRLRVEFSTAARMDTGAQGLRTLAGSELRDGQQIVMGGETFELAFGPTIVLPPGSVIADFYRAADAGVPGSAANTRVTVNVGGTTFVLNDGRRNVNPAAGEVNVPLADPTAPGGPTLQQLTASDVAAILAAAIEANRPAATVDDNFDFSDEPNDELSQATPAPVVPGDLTLTGQGTIVTDKDVDLIRLDVTVGTTVLAQASSGSAQLTPLVRLFDAEGNEVARGGATPAQYTAVVDGPIYAGFSSDENSIYNPAVAGSGEPGSIGRYDASISLSRNYGAITNGNRVEVTGGTPVSVPPGSPLVVDGSPATTGLPIYVNSGMTAEQVAAAVRDAAARQFADGETGAYRVHNATVTLPGISIDDPGPFSLTGQRWGDRFGDLGASRARQNAFEGVYVDDFIIGFAERGEMATGATNVSAFIPDPSPALTSPPQPVSDLVTGTYQLEIRDASEYVASSGLPSLFRTVDTNDRLSAATTIVARPASELVDGMTFTIGDGGAAITFEFDLVESGSGIQPGRVRVPYTLQADEPGTAEIHPITGQPIAGTGVVRPQTAEEVAASIVAAINSQEVQQLLDVSALPASGIDTTGDATINLFNAVSVIDPSSSLASITRSTGRGDANRQRTSQGIILVENSQFAFNDQYGVDIVHDVTANVAGNTGNALVRHPRNLVELNTERLVTGVVVQSNVMAFNEVGGIRISGIAAGESAADPVPFDRIVNNTIIGGEVVAGLSAPTATFGGLLFEQGTTAFADLVANYNPLAGGGPAPDVAFTDPTRALGAPDAETPGAEPTAGGSVVSLGRGGSLTVEFTDNLLTGSGDSLPDLAVFETGVLESVLVEISRNGVTFFNVGIIGGTTNTLDIDAAGFGVQDRFAFVRLTDLRQGDPNSPTRGADIDAVGALSSVALDEFTAGGVGITVRQNASPTLLNNVVANSDLGVDIDASSAAKAVLGGMAFYRNAQPITTGVSLGQFAQQLSPAEQVFVAPGDLVFAPASGASIIDSSIDSLLDRASLVTVRGPLGLQRSPILAPTFDVNGQLRVDDPAVESPFGLGERVFKDRGAADRADQSGPRAVLLLPRADDSGTNAGVAEIFGKSPEAFEIQLVDGIAPSDPVPGVGVDDSSVNSNSLLLLKDGVPLVEGVDYRFGYNPSTNVIRLTPLAGVWENDSVYLIRMLDASDAVLEASAGEGYTDGATFDVIDSSGNVTTFEYEAGITITVPAALLAVNGGDGATFDLNIGGTPFTLELDNNAQVGPGNVPVTIPLNATVDDVARAVADLVNEQQLLLQATALPGGRVRLTGQGVLSASDLVDGGVPATGDIGTRVGFGIGVPANGSVPTDIADGQTFTISRGASQQVVFELDNNNLLSNPLAIPVRLPVSPSLDDVAGALVRAIGGAGLGLNPQNVGHGRVVLGGSAAYSLDLSNTGLVQLGIPGQRASVPVVIPPAATAIEVAAIIAQAIESAALPGITTSQVGRRILVEGTGGVAGAGALELGAVRDRVGNLLQSNQGSGRTELTIFVGAGFDYGDAPAPYASTLADGGPRHSVGPGLSLGPDVTPDADARLPNGDTDDGVGVNGTIQRGFDATFEVDVRSDRTDPAVLDLWIDWDADGVFEASEKSRFSVTNAVTTIRLDVPATAATGTTYARFRLSSDGVGSPTGEALDGEVEDWAIVVQSNPFQNPNLRADVNDSGTVTPLDALQIINALNRAGQLSIPLDSPVGFQLPTYPDVSGDGVVTALDALQVINELNRMLRAGQTSGEGEAVGDAAVSYVPTTDGVYASALTVASDPRLWSDGSGTSSAVQPTAAAEQPRQAENTPKTASFNHSSVFDGAATIAVEEVLDTLASGRTASPSDRPAGESPLDSVFAALGQ